MGNYYLHKNKNMLFTTLKDTIILDLDKVKDSYEYEENILKKSPKHLKITGSSKDFWSYHLYFRYFPVEDVSICKDILTYKRAFFGFHNVTILKIEDNVKSVYIIDNMGLVSIRNISIPFKIEEFRNNCNMIKHNIKTINVYSENDEISFCLDNNLLDDDIKIEAKKIDDHLIIKTFNDKTDIEYDVYLKENKLYFNKKYNKYEINGNEYDYDTKELNIIELKKKYNKLSFKNYFNYIKKVVLNKEDISLLTEILLNRINELEIIEDNDMSLIPRKVHIKLDKEKNKYIDKIEIINDNLLLKAEDGFHEDIKYIIINKDLSYIDFTKDDLYKINKVYLDLDSNKFSLNEEDGRYNLTIPFNKKFDLDKYGILRNIIVRAKRLVIKNKNIEKTIDKFVINYEDYTYMIKNIKNKDNYDFITYYDGIDNILSKQHFIYVYDKENNNYIENVGQGLSSNADIEYIHIKQKLLKKK